MRVAPLVPLALFCASAQAQEFLQPLPCSQESLLSAINDNTPTSILFANATTETVRVYWKNFSGNRVLYFTLPPGASGNQGTWVTHPWVITDTNDTCLAIFEGTPAPSVARISIVGLVLTEAGLTFQAVQGGPAPQPGSFSVLAGSGGTIPLNISTATASGGSWLSVSTSNTVADPKQPAATIRATANPTGLSAGDYYGQVRIDAPGAPNTPLFVSVILNVAPPGGGPGGMATPTGLTFVGAANGSSPSNQTIRITTPGNSSLPYQIGATVSSGTNWLTASPTSGTLVPGQPIDIQTQVNLTGLSPGVYRGNVSIQFSQNTATVAVVLVVTSPPVSSSAVHAAVHTDAATACLPASLDPVFTTLGSNFNSPAGWPTPIEVLVVDDCGVPLQTGSVVASFSNGDAPLSLISHQNGSWSATWAPSNALSSSTQVTATAKEASPALTGAVSLGGIVAPNPAAPQLAAGGAVSAANYLANATPSPGELVAVFGANMADGSQLAPSLPLATGLENSSIAMAGQLLPIQFASSGQINVVIPYEIPAGTIQQMVLQRGNRISLPQLVTIGPAEPAIFSADGSGTGQGTIFGFPTPTQQILAAPATPAQAGEILVIYSTGLGPVSPAVEAGTATPSDQLYQTANPVTLSIGGASATVLFSGLTPGFTGLYQVNAEVPSGVTGNQLPVILTVSGISSAPVTMAVQ